MSDNLYCQKSLLLPVPMERVLGFFVCVLTCPALSCCNFTDGFISQPVATTGFETEKHFKGATVKYLKS